MKASVRQLPSPTPYRIIKVFSLCVAERRPTWWGGTACDYLNRGGRSPPPSPHDADADASPAASAAKARRLQLRSANAEPNAESCCGRQSHPEDDITASGAENIPLRTEATQCFPWPLLIYFVVGGRLGVGGQALPILTTDR